MSRQSIEERFAEFEAIAVPSFRPLGVSPTISRVLRRRRRRRTTLAAAVVLACALVIPTQLATHQGTPPSDPNVPAGPAVMVIDLPTPGEAFYRTRPAFRFVDRDHGWAAFSSCPSEYSAENCQVALLSTSDGGHTWHRVGLPSLPGATQIDVYPLDRNTFTVQVVPSGTYLLTRDGGAHFAAPTEQLPVEGQLAHGGEFQVLCPDGKGFGPDHCDETVLYHVGVGPVSGELPWAFNFDARVRILHGADGRLWCLEDVDGPNRRLAVSTDQGRSWQMINPLPEGLFTLSPDGSHAWVVGDGTIFDLVGATWVSRVGPRTPGSVAAGVIALSNERMMVADGVGVVYYSQDGKRRVLSGLASGPLLLLPDGTVLLEPGTANGIYLGVPSGDAHDWTYLRFRGWLPAVPVS